MNSANSVPWILEVIYADLFLKNTHFHHNLVGLNFCNIGPSGDEIEQGYFVLSLWHLSAGQTISSAFTGVCAGVLKIRTQ